MMEDKDLELQQALQQTQEMEQALQTVFNVMKQFTHVVPMWNRDVPAMPITGNLFIAVERWQRNDESRVAELHIVDGNGKWGGPGVTIYAADLDIGILRSDDAKPEDFVEPAYCSASSSITKSTAQTRAQARMIMLAADLADAYTELDRPMLIERAQEVKKQMAEDSRRREERLQARAKLMAEVARYVDTNVRITISSRKTPLSGRLADAVSSGKIALESHATYQLMIGEVTKLEWKNERGRYEDTGLIK